MMADGTSLPGYHQDTSLFRDALNYTASTTGFRSLLIEKDYYCSLVLQDLAEFFNSGLVFKGGTCLSKVHLDFYRLSEDLDFAISIAANSRASNRSAAISPTRQHLTSLCQRHDCFTESEALIGHNNSKQYNAVYSYRSVITGQEEVIKLEVSLREPLLLPVEKRHARTLLMDPFTKKPAFNLVEVSVLAEREAYAEKIRAALTRREPAIRDFFDIDSAVRKGSLNHQEEAILTLVQQKLEIPGNDSINMSPEKKQNLERQITAQLAAVLRQEDYDNFDLERAFALVDEVARLISGRL
jgi:predicted nucleotidyltransferase component of viral defense system